MQDPSHPVHAPLFLMSSMCVFRENLDHLVTKDGKDLLDHLETR